MEAFLDYVKKLDESLFNALTKLPLDEYSEFNKTVELYMKMKFAPIHHRFDMIMNDLRNHLNNITLVLLNGEVSVNKTIISIIPYFEYLFEHESVKHIKINFTVNTLSILIDWVYFHTFDSNKIPVSSNLQLLNAMDMMMYHEFSEAMIKLLEKTIKILIHDYYNNEELDNLLLLEHLIYNLKIIHPTINFDNIVSAFSSCKKYICHFTHINVFDSEDQYDAIMKLGNYKHFNRSTVDPKKVLEALIDFYPESECYYDVYNSKTIVVQNQNTNKIILNNSKEYMVIHSYEPFHYTKYKKFNYPTHVLNIDTNEIIIKLSKSLNVPIGSCIVIADNDKDVFVIDLKSPIYTITEIHRRFKIDDTTYDIMMTNELKYYKNIDYLLTLDKPLHTDEGITFIVTEHIYE
jgi:hypothetical protein